jgi:hypothetical protein
MKIKLFEEFEFGEETNERGRKFKTFKLEDIEPLVKSNIPFKQLRQEEDYKGTHKYNEYVEEELEFDGSHYTIHLMYAPYQKTSYFECGWIVLKDEEPVYLVFIYEPHNCYANKKRGMVTFDGHEEIVNLWLDEGEFGQHFTR